VVEQVPLTMFKNRGEEQDKQFVEADPLQLKQVVEHKEQLLVTLFWKKPLVGQVN